MTRYILNTLTIPVNFDKHQQARVVMEKVDPHVACTLIREGISAVGHQAPADVINDLCKTDIKPKRDTIFFEPKDEGIHLVLKQRLPEGKIATRKEMEEIGYWFIRSQRIDVKELEWEDFREKLYKTKEYGSYSVLIDDMRKQYPELGDEEFCKSLKKFWFEGKMNLELTSPIDREVFRCTVDGRLYTLIRKIK